MISIFSLFPLVLFILFLLKWLYTSSPTKKKLPPSPPKLPIMGNLHQLGSQPHRGLQKLSEKYGPLMLLHFGSKPVLVASSAEAAREIMKTHDLIFSSRPKLSVPGKLLFNFKDVAFSPYGEYWRQTRSICVLQLLNNKRVQSFQYVREEETSEMIEKIRRTCSASLINMSEVLITLTNDIVCRIVLGKKYSQEETGREVISVLSEFVELLGGLCIADYIPSLAWLNRLNGFEARVDRVAKELDEVMERVIEEHSKSDYDKIDKCPDFVDILLELQRNNSVSFPLEHDTLKALILDMFGAGTDTTHSIMEWAMTELLRHPDIMEKLQNEVRQVAHGKAEVTENDIEKMQYLKAVIKETLRLRLPVPLLVPRESTRDIRVMGYDISAGTQVIVNAWAIARDPLLWKNPDEFKPERFLDGTDIDFRGLNFELIPFGAGRRGCPGINFGIAVNELALAKLMHNFNFSFPEGAEEKDLHVPESNGITVHRKSPLLAVVTPYSA